MPENITCKVRCGTNYLGDHISITLWAPDSEDEIHFDLEPFKWVAQPMKDRCLVGYRAGGTVEMTTDELEKLRTLEKYHQERKAFGIRISSQPMSFAKRPARRR